VIERYRCFLKTSRSVRNWRSGLFFYPILSPNLHFPAFNQKKLNKKPEKWRIDFSQIGISGKQKN